MISRGMCKQVTGSLLTGVLAMAAGGVCAQTLSTNISGTITPGTCKIESKDVGLGKFEQSAFSGVGTGTKWTSFGLATSGCPAYVKSVLMAFKGTADQNNPNLFRVNGGASGIGLDLQTYNDQQAVPNGAAMSWGPRKSGETYDFKVRYMQTTAQIKGGKANASVEFWLTYL
jgi:type 1 fimbria pilin